MGLIIRPQIIIPTRLILTGWFRNKLKSVCLNKLAIQIKLIPLIIFLIITVNKMRLSGQILPV